MFMVEMKINGAHVRIELAAEVEKLAKLGLRRGTLQIEPPDPQSKPAEVFTLRVESISSLAASRLLALFDSAAVIEFKLLRQSLPKISAKARRKMLDNRLDDVMTGVVVQTRNALRNDRILFVGDLVGQTTRSLLNIPGIGKVGTRQIRDWLATQELELGTQPDDWQRPT